MTGYGHSECIVEDVHMHILVHSLNAKYLDVSPRLPALLESHERSCRRLVATYISRGKVSITVECRDMNSTGPSYEIDASNLKRHYEQLKSQITDEKDLRAILGGILNIHGVVRQKLGDEKMPEWARAEACMVEALEACKQMQQEEGEALTKKILDYIVRIKTTMGEVEAMEPTREARLREKLQKRMDKWIEAARYSKERMEEEMLYYLERMSFEEEKVRLLQHLSLFEATLHREHTEGKKLSFITQEIARELNTLGAKAADADIQQRVVEMKNELEKIREQLLNAA